MSSVPEGVFLSTLQPNTTTSSYALPSEGQLGYGGGGNTDEAFKAQRVQEQVRLRMTQKKTSQSSAGQSATLTKTTGQGYGDSKDLGLSSVKYATVTPGYSSRSFMYQMESKAAVPLQSRYGTVRTGGWSSRSAVDMGSSRKMSVGRSGGGNVYQTRHTTVRRVSRPQPDLETMSLRSLRLPNGPPVMPVAGWDDGESSMISDQVDGGMMQQSLYGGSSYGTSSQYRHISSNDAPGTMSLRRTASGTLPHGLTGQIDYQEQVDMVPQQSRARGPAMRTLNRIQTNNRFNRMSMGSISGASTMQQQQQYASNSFVSNPVQTTNGSYSSLVQQQIPRATSMRSLHSMTKGMDTYDDLENVTDGVGNMAVGFDRLNMGSAVESLSSSDTAVQVLGAAFIQHECYNKTESKNQARHLKAIPKLVTHFNSDNLEVQRFATGAMRNLIYENTDNKMELINCDGLVKLMKALQVNDDELRKNITGILWNLSSKEDLKEKLAITSLSDLTKNIVKPLTAQNSTGRICQNASEAEIFCNTTGCLRNLSSVSDNIRNRMRDSSELVDSLIRYMQDSVENGKTEEKGLENVVCILRNLSFNLYTELPPSVLLKLDGPTRREEGNSKKSDTIGCFTPQSKKAKQKQGTDLYTFSEISKEPIGREWLWHPNIIEIYNKLLQKCEINNTTREAAAGALQNITAGDKRWAGVLSRVALEQHRILPTVLDSLRTNNEQELRSVTGFLRNLSRHAPNKDDFATKVVNNLIAKLPNDSRQDQPSVDVIMNICATLNNLVANSSMAARDIVYFDGVNKLVDIKRNKSSPGREKAADAANTVLSNMLRYTKLHRDLKKKGFHKRDLLD